MFRGPGSLTRVKAGPLTAPDPANVLPEIDVSVPMSPYRPAPRVERSWDLRATAVEGFISPSGQPGFVA